jgi:CheY-like chemotaxis protein
MNSLTVLLAEDNAHVRKLVREVVEMVGLSVLEASDGTAALAIAARSPSSIDLLLTDVAMPGIDGVELARRVRLLRPETRVRYMSASDPHELMTWGFSFPRGELIPKPFGVYELIERVGDALGVADRLDSFERRAIDASA